MKAPTIWPRSSKGPLMASRALDCQAISNSMWPKSGRESEMRVSISRAEAMLGPASPMNAEARRSEVVLWTS